MIHVFYLGSLDKAISWSSGGSHNNPGRAIMDHRRDPGPLKAPDTTGVGHDCDDSGAISAVFAELKKSVSCFERCALLSSRLNNPQCVAVAPRKV